MHLHLGQRFSSQVRPLGRFWLHPRRIALPLAIIAAMLSGARIHGQQSCPCSIWTLSTTPGPELNDGNAVELGVKFRADNSGYITGIRFYKYADDTGTHLGNLWTTGGALLGSVTFTGESASGWQQANFSSPIAITGGTTYVASYHTNTGFFAATGNGFTTAVDNAPLHALANGVAGGNGVYLYGSGGFPNQSYLATNYWVDVVYVTTLAPDTTPPTVVSTSPTNGATGLSTGTTVAATFSESVNPTTVTTTTMTLRNNSTNALVTATVATNGAIATLTPSAPLSNNTSYTATVKGGSSGVKDLAGNPLAADFSWSFTTVAAPSCPCSIWSTSTSPGPVASDGNAIELGVKFRADSSGYISGLRFYKYSQNTGTHVGSLWTSGGGLLGSLTFSGETASGWQQGTFASAIPITAGTTYVASYHTNTGFYASTSHGLDTGVDTGPLHALADGVAGGNGVYQYGGGGFPSDTYLATNYWVDVVFVTTAPPDTTPPTVVSSVPTGGATGISTGTTVSATFSEAVNPATVTTTTMTLRNNSTSALVTATVATNGATATLTPSAALSNNTNYTTTVKGGSSGVKDLAGNALAADFSWSFTTVVSPICPCSIWTMSTTPGPVDTDGLAIEVGVKFRADSSGYISGLRFYKYAQNTGTHVGNLWTLSGTLLGTLTFSGETASGWQQANFSSPIPISGGTTYVASYHTNNGFHAATRSGLDVGVNTGPLHALADGVAGGNGVYQYGGGYFPDQTWSASNYWVDIVFVTTVPADTTPPTVVGVTPGNGATGVSRTAIVRTTFSETIDPATVTTTTMTLRNTSTGTLVAATVASNGNTSTLTPSAVLPYSATFTATVKGGSTGVKDLAGNPLAADFVWGFTTAPPPTSPNDGAGGPILVVASPSNLFARFYAEILRAEGLNEFAVSDLSAVTGSLLAGYDVVILGEQALTTSQVTMFTTWVQNGGNLIAMRPDKKLAPLLGLSDVNATLPEGYLLMDTSKAPGAGLVSRTIQYHGTADEYATLEASPVATLYSTATAPTPYPAVTLRTGVNGGTGAAAAFTYDLARSVVYTRQGNPAWAGQERDGSQPIRSDDLFFGQGGRDWVDFSNIAIPQADEQQRLLANLILSMNATRKPLPRLWYFPRGKKAVVVMTGDDHYAGGTSGRFTQYVSQSPSGCVVENWECIRGSSYMFPGVPMTNLEAASWIAQGFDIGLHTTMDPASTTYGCGVDFTLATLTNAYTTQLAQLAANFPSLPAPTTHRMHCIMWSDWASQPQVELSKGIRFDVTYYYWPSWFAATPGLFTGSGMPMRFAAMNGSMFDVYQATSQMTDESGQSYPFTINTLLDNALGATAYYGAFTANMHTDYPASQGSDAIVASALARSVPIVSAKQMLTWLDGRNQSAFGPMTWASNRLTFSITPGAGANGLQVMIPTQVGTLHLTGITLNGAAVASTTQTIKGVQYAFVTVGIGQYQATYAP